MSKLDQAAARNDGSFYEPGEDDAFVSIEISNDSMEAFISDWGSPKENGAELTVDMIGEYARRAGVTIDLDPEGIREVFARLAAGNDLRGTVIARGIPPREARDALVKPIGDLNYPVLPGSVFATLVPHENMAVGTNVLGKPVAPRNTKNPVQIMIPQDGGCVLDENDKKFRATVYGLARIQSGLVSVTSLVKISPDRKTATATIYHVDFMGNPTLPTFESAFTASGVKVGLTLEDAEKAVAQAELEKKPVPDVRIAGMVPPQNGADGHFQWIFKKQDARGKVDEEGRMDYYDRGWGRVVKENESIGMIISPGRGIPGALVTGEPIPARDGNPLNISCGENVKTSSNGMEYYATATGVVVLSQNKLSVTDLFYIDQDIDATIGNVNMEKGSLKVKGGIHSGFRINVPGMVYIGDSVTNAYIDAGGDVIIRRGVFMNDEGYIRAGGRITAKYAMNATLEAGLDIEIDNEIFNCEVLAGGKITALKGKGIIKGGRLRCSAGLYANELGSDIATPTLVILGEELKRDEELLCKRREIRDNLKKIKNFIGVEDPMEMLKRAHPSKREAIANLIKAKIRFEKELKECEQEIRSIQRQNFDPSIAVVKVRKVVYPGVTIIIASNVVKVDKEMQNVSFFYCCESGKIETSTFS